MISREMEIKIPSGLDQAPLRYSFRLQASMTAVYMWR